MCSTFGIVEDGFLKTFFEKTQSLTPKQRADYLEEDDVSQFCIKFVKVCCIGVHPSIAQLVERWTVVV